MAQHQPYSKIEKFWSLTFSHTPFWCSKLIRITFSSDLREICWITGKNLSPKSKKCPILENNHIYIRSNRMRNLHKHNRFNIIQWNLMFKNGYNILSWGYSYPIRSQAHKHTSCILSFLFTATWLSLLLQAPLNVPWWNTLVLHEATLEELLREEP